jgi:hypothetical protein
MPNSVGVPKVYPEPAENHLFPITGQHSELFTNLPHAGLSASPLLTQAFRSSAQVPALTLVRQAMA